MKISKPLKIMPYIEIQTEPLFKCGANPLCVERVCHHLTKQEAQEHWNKYCTDHHEDPEQVIPYDAPPRQGGFFVFFADGSF